MRITTYDAALERVTFVGSLNGQIGSGERHDPDDVAAEGNASFRALEKLVTDRGFSFYVSSTAVASQPAADANFDWREVPWDQTYQSVVGVDVAMPGDSKRWERLEYVNWEQRHLYADTGYPYPIAYTIRDVANESEDGAILLLPAGDGGRYVLHFLPTHADIGTGESFRYLSGPCEDWHVADWALRIVGARDGDSGSRVANLKEMRASAAEQISQPRVHAAPESVMVEMTGARGGAWRRRGFGPR